MGGRRKEKERKKAIGKGRNPATALGTRKPDEAGGRGGAYARRETTLMTLLPPCSPKYLVLIILVIQNTCLVLLMRYSRTRPGTMYLGSTAVCCDEAMKLFTCLGILAISYLWSVRDRGVGYDRLGMSEMIVLDDRNGVGNEEDDDDCSFRSVQIDNASARQHNSFREYLGEQLKFDFRMAGLAGLYTLQKNLLYLAISNLDAAVFQVTYQTKILVTAVFSVLLLGKKLNRTKIIALFMLTLGVSLVQLDKVDENASKSYQEQHRWVGVLAVLGACFTSGFGGVFFELVIKPRSTDTTMGPPCEPPSIWVKNVQLSVFALIIALITAFAKDHEAILSNGFFQGYSRLVVLVIALEAGGGLVVAAVIKYADNILKSFATSVSIVTSTIVSAWVFGFTISKLFVGGCVFVFFSSVLYARDDEVIVAESSDIQYMPVEQANVDDSVDLDEEDNKVKEGMESP